VATPGMMEFENIQIQLIDTPPLSEQPPEWWLMNIIKRVDGLLLVIALDDDPLGQVEAMLAILHEKRIGLGRAPENAPEDEDAPYTWKKVLLVANKIDLDPGGAVFQVLQELYHEKLPAVAISALGQGLEELRRKIFEMLDIIRVYTKTPGGKPDMTDPIILEKGSTLEAAAASVHKDFASKLKFARIWGSGKFEGVMARRDHVLQDGDIIELHV